MWFHVVYDVDIAIAMSSTMFSNVVPCHQRCGRSQSIHGMPRPPPPCYISRLADRDSHCIFVFPHLVVFPPRPLWFPHRQRHRTTWKHIVNDARQGAKHR